MGNVQPFEARNLPDLPSQADGVMTQLLIAVNGFAYPGSAADALYLGVRWLRANPDKAAELLGAQPAANATGDASAHSEGSGRG